MALNSQPDLVSNLQTEGRNARSAQIDQGTTLELCQIINAEDATVAHAVEQCIPVIAEAIDALAERVRRGGRVVYVGAGTSGRLGVLDASEIPPTYSAPPSQFVGLIAGGDGAIRSAIEGAEDSLEAARTDLDRLQLDGERDSLIGIAASGRTPYVLGCLAYAKQQGCVTVGIACSAPSAMSRDGRVDFMINAVTGPEVIAGSTRMKAGTATKLVLNMISTGVMIKLGKTWGNVMIDVRPTNIKLQHRARRILRDICGARCPVTDKDLDAILESCNQSVKLAAAVMCLGVSVGEAQRLLEDANGVLAKVLKDSNVNMSARETRESMSYFLCVDAGGSKCAAAICRGDGVEGGGTGGPCNVAEIGVDAAASQISLAVKRAAESCAVNAKCSPGDIRIESAWIGVAGGDRRGMRAEIHAALYRTLPLGPQASLQVTSDIELLAKIAGTELQVDHLVVLVAGTGSVAMRYVRSQDDFTCVDRSGGWGSSLGDDGSGYSIGRQAIRFALRDLEARQRAGDKSNDGRGMLIDPLTKLILEFFGLREDDSSQDLLNAVLMTTANSGQETSTVKRRIAECAQLVVDASSDCSGASSIVHAAQDHLVALVRDVLPDPGINSEHGALVLSGGLMKSVYFADSFKRRLLDARIQFQDVTCVSSPALAGARLLWSNMT